jgi:iron complex transport system ATP-binding protein
MNKPGKIIIELENIYHRFPDSDWELNISEFTLSSRKVLGIIGPNGSGKSTLLRIAAGVLEPLRGTIRLEHQELQNLDRVTIARHLGYLPQELASLYDVTVEDVVRMGRYAHTKGFGSLDRSDLDAVRYSLEITEMDTLRKRPLSHLSGGERKRAFLASVLAQQPKVLLLDEPTSALDIHYQVQFFRLLRNLAKKGMGVAVVTHDINFASLFSDGLMFLVEGRCIATGPPKHVLTSETMHLVYGKDILMGQHPESNRPFILPRIFTEKKE